MNVFVIISNMIQMRVHFAGHVQGVGFRYTARKLAVGYELSGFVTNLDDGRVLLEIEGQEAELTRFLDALNERMHDHIHLTQITRNPATGQFAGNVSRGLTIRH